MTVLTLCYTNLLREIVTDTRRGLLLHTLGYVVLLVHVTENGVEFEETRDGSLESGGKSETRPVARNNTGTTSTFVGRGLEDRKDIDEIE